MEKGVNGLHAFMVNAFKEACDKSPFKGKSPEFDNYVEDCLQNTTIPYYADEYRQHLLDANSEEEYQAALYGLHWNLSHSFRSPSALIAGIGKCLFVCPSDAVTPYVGVV